MSISTTSWGILSIKLEMSPLVAFSTHWLTSSTETRGTGRDWYLMKCLGENIISIHFHLGWKCVSLVSTWPAIPPQKTASLQTLKSIKIRMADGTNLTPNVLKTTIYSKGLTHLVAGTCALQLPVTCFSNVVEDVQACDGNRADCERVGS